MFRKVRHMVALQNDSWLLKTRQSVHCQRDGTPNWNFRGTPFKKMRNIPTNYCDSTSFSPKNGPIRLIYHKNGMSDVMCYVLYMFSDYHTYIYIYSCAFLHKYYLISQILNVWSIYLHLGSLGANVGIYTSPNERLGKWIWFVCVHHKWCKPCEKKVNSNLLENHSPAWTIDIRDEDLLSLQYVDCSDVIQTLYSTSEIKSIDIHDTLGIYYIWYISCFAHVP